MAATRNGNSTTSAPVVLHMAFELAENKWKLAFSTGLGQKPRLRRVEARDLESLNKEIARAKERFGLPATTKVISCYEAGRDGFWLHRWLESEGIENLVVDSSSIEVNRRRRRAKTDRLDAAKLVTMLLRWTAGERKAWSVVNVPSEEDEDDRQLCRELDHLMGQRTSHLNRIQGLLASQGLKLKVDEKFEQKLGQLRTWNNHGVGAGLRGELVREYKRLCLLEEQIKELCKERVAAIKNDQTRHVDKIRKLLMLRGVGVAGSTLFVRECFGWRDITNRRQVGSLFGLVPTPYASGDTCQEQGISKAGNRRARKMAVEIAWCWVRYQPHSELTQWFNRRFAKGSGRHRRIGIVALARKLMVALWRYLEFDEVPAGAELVSWEEKIGWHVRARAVG